MENYDTPERETRQVLRESQENSCDLLLLQLNVSAAAAIPLPSGNDEAAAPAPLSPAGERALPGSGMVSTSHIQRGTQTGQGATPGRAIPIKAGASWRS